MTDDLDPTRQPLDPEALDVNDLARFRKQPTHLLLESYSHCEVPAGCGGVVLRWTSPDGPVRVGVRVHGEGTCRGVIVDGDAHRGSQAELAPGKRVLVLKLEFHDGCPPDAACMIAVGTALSEVSTSGAAAADFGVGSRLDGSWQLATREPIGDALTDVRPDASLWSVPARGHIEPPEEDHWSHWSWDACAAVAAQAIALPAGPGAIWLRTVVEVPAHADEDADD